jgi:hypothetical protein
MNNLSLWNIEEPSPKVERFSNCQGAKSSFSQPCLNSSAVKAETALEQQFKIYEHSYEFKKKQQPF